MTAIPVRPLPVSEVAQQLAPHIAVLAEHFRGLPNAALSTTGRELRWGRKGSFVISLSGKHRWRWSDYETGASGDGIDLIARERGCSLPEAARWAADWLRLPSGSRSSAAIRKPVPARPMAEAQDDDEDLIRQAKTELAMATWREGLSVIGTPVEKYLVGRGIAPEAIAGACGHAIRFHPQCPSGVEWRDGGLHVWRRRPAMIALPRNVVTNAPCGGLHRTFLKTDGSGKAGDKAKFMLGTVANCAVKLSPDDAATLGIGICEGLETALALLSIGIAPVWACLAAGQVRHFPVLAGIESLTIYADNDRAKGEAQRRAGQEAAEAVAQCWADAGREAEIVLPPGEGTDWLDALAMGRAAA